MKRPAPVKTSSSPTLPLPPAAPTNLTGAAVDSGKKADVTISWLGNASRETSFEIQRASNPSFTAGFNSTSVEAKSGCDTLVTVTQTGLYRGVIYYYRVRAVNLGGPSAWSNVIAVITP